MAASGLLRERDLRVLTAVIQDGLRDDPGEAMPWVVLERLQQLIPSDTVALADHDVARSVLLREQGVNDGGGSGIYRGDDGDNEEDDPRFWKLRNEFLPNMYSARAGDLVSALRWSDFYTLSEMRNTPFLPSTSLPGWSSSTTCSSRSRQDRAKPGAWGSGARTATTANGIDSPFNCCGRTCTRSTSTPNADAAASRTSAGGRRKFSNSHPRATATPTSPGFCSSRRRLWPSTWSTSSTAPGFAPEALRPP